MDEEQKQRYIRWQEYRINQLSFSINLFLGFAVASLGYAINLKLESRIPDSTALPSIILWSASAFLGCVVTLSRLMDFRFTARKIKDGGECNELLAMWFGSITWDTFWGQVIAYAAGACWFVVAILRT